jgi:hypothetical protein
MQSNYGIPKLLLIAAIFAGACGAAQDMSLDEQEDAAKINPNCSLIVPANPLSPQGLATPYQLVATNPKKGACHETNVAQSAFVQGAVFDPATGNISIYNPLVIDKGTAPAIAPVQPTLPANAVVALWFGFNGTNLTLQSADGKALADGMCVNGSGNSVFGQFAYCNAPAFFTAANQAIMSGRLVIPPLGTANNGQPCPSLRDFSVVDMDQSDNVDTAYVVSQGKLAQNTEANRAKLKKITVLTNASDNGLLDAFIDPALGCTPFLAPDLADNNKMVSALPLNELQAAIDQATPVALVPAADPMVLVNAKANLTKQNAYRAGVGQAAEPSANQAAADQTTYCKDLLNVGAARLKLDRPLTVVAASPNLAVANSLFTFLAQRFNTTFGPNGLNCTGLLKKANPIQLKMQNGIVVDAKINIQ